MSADFFTCLALDIGGANLKGAHSSGGVDGFPFELWKRPGELAQGLVDLASRLPAAERIAVTMTAELCDCYVTRSQGVLAVLDAVETAFPGRPTLVWGVDAQFHAIAPVRERPLIAAASNWLALATVAAALVPDGPGLLIDIGSTTADLIPLADGKVTARGRTDLERLQTGELVYAGVRRTPVCALAPELPFRGVATATMAELFATTLDVYLVLEEIPPDPANRATADGRPATPDAAIGRLARMIGLDGDEFTRDDAKILAQACDQWLVDRLTSAAARACAMVSGPRRRVVVAGSGEFLARRVAARLVEPEAIVGLESEWGPAASTAACARALAVLASDPAVWSARG